MRLLALVYLVLVGLHAQAQETYRPPHEKPGPAVERLLFRAFAQERAPLDLRAGNMDLYLFGLRPDAAQEMRRATGFRLYEAPATALALLLNPAPAPSGRLNPFALKEVRQAVQYLVDREFIARSIFRGQALPMVSPASPLDYDFLTVYELVRGAGFRYDPERARSLIAQAMRQAGAELVGGKWRYRGEPIRLRILARVEDERRAIGDLLRAQLEAMGFEVVMVYQTFAPAVLTVYSTDPRSLEWHIYTEGWSRGGAQLYDFATINQMYAPWAGNMPGWRQPGFWQYEQPELDRLGLRLFRGEFSSPEERNRLYRRMTELGLEESVRVWLVTALNAFPVREGIQGVVSDLSAGLRSPLSLREAYLPGRDQMVVGNLWVWTERSTWNPVGGLGDLYSTDIWRHLYDPPLFNHPYTGLPSPFRAEFKVETAGPRGKLAVPPDAVVWDAQKDQWRPVGSGVRATSRVTFDYTRYYRSRWHHGQAIRPSDLLYALVQAYELAYDPDKSRIEVALAVTARPILETFQGYRLLDDGRLEVYVDFWHFEPRYIAAYASPSAFAMPWEVLYAMDDLVFRQRRAAYSDTAAARLGVPWLSLVLERDARLVERTLRQLLSQNSLPVGAFQIGARTWSTPEEARVRYQAALAWFQERRHLVISNGPFLLSRYDPAAQFAELLAFRDPSYPFRPGELQPGPPPELSISRVEAPRVLQGRPASIRVSLRGPKRLELVYLLLEPTAGKVFLSGRLQAQEGEVLLSLDPATTARLAPGLYHLYLVLSSEDVARITERRVDLEVATP